MIKLSFTYVLHKVFTFLSVFFTFLSFKRMWYRGALSHSFWMWYRGLYNILWACITFCSGQVNDKMGNMFSDIFYIYLFYVSEYHYMTKYTSKYVVLELFQLLGFETSCEWGFHRGSLLGKNEFVVIWIWMNFIWFPLVVMMVHVDMSCTVQANGF